MSVEKLSLIHRHAKPEPKDKVPPQPRPHTILGVPLHIITAVVEIELLVGKISKVILNIKLVYSQLQDLEH